MTTKPQSTDPERLGDEEGSRGNARISLRMGNGLAFTGGLGLVKTEAGVSRLWGEMWKKKGDTAGTGGIWRLMQKPSTMEASWNL